MFRDARKQSTVGSRAGPVVAGKIDVGQTKTAVTTYTDAFDLRGRPNETKTRNNSPRDGVIATRARSRNVFFFNYFIARHVHNTVNTVYSARNNRPYIIIHRDPCNVERSRPAPIGPRLIKIRFCRRAIPWPTSAFFHFSNADGICRLRTTGRNN